MTEDRLQCLEYLRISGSNEGVMNRVIMGGTVTTSILSVLGGLCGTGCPVRQVELVSC